MRLVYWMSKATSSHEYRGVAYDLYFEGWEGECSICQTITVIGRTKASCAAAMKEHIDLAHLWRGVSPTTSAAEVTGE